MTIDFNLNTLKHYQNSSDELDQETAQTTLKDFKDYAKIVSTFDQQMNTWKQELSGQDYRENVGSLDSQRRRIHNQCLSDISILNKMAEMDNLPPFSNATKDTPRQDVGQAIIAYGFESVVNNEQAIMPSKKPTRDTVNDYNYMFSYTKYPLVKKNDQYEFMDLFTGKKADENVVETYVKNRTEKPEDLEKFDDAKNLVAFQINLDGLSEEKSL